MMLTAFTAALLLITICELGDKSFFIAMLLAMRHPRRLVFIGAMVALVGMTLLSVVLGQVLSLFPPIYTRVAAIALFCFFGLKLLYDASQMHGKEVQTELAEAEAAVKAADAKLPRRNPKLAVVGESTLLTFLTEWGDRTQIATITLAAAHHPLGVTVGAIFGHAVCTGLAVMGGKLVAGRISERTITLIGGTLFLLFGILTWREGLSL